jgi:hypothetical protein
MACLERHRGDHPNQAVLEEIKQHPATREAARQANLVIAGRYSEPLRIGERLRGSSNKAYHFLTDEYRIDEFTTLPQFEAVINKDGTVHVTGVAGSDSLTQALRLQVPPERTWPGSAGPATTATGGG